MEKRITWLLIVTILLTVFSGCSQPATTEAPVTEAVTEAVTEVTEPETEPVAKTTSPIIITDQLGRTIEFDEPPQRLATAIMPFPYIFHAVMGNNEYMIGCNPSSMTAYEKSTLRYMYPAMANANTDWVDASFVVNIEELLKLEPDVVFQWGSKPEEIEKMENAGLKVIALKYGTMEDLETWFRIISSLYQKEERGEELIEYFNDQIAEVTDKISTLDPSEYRNILEFTFYLVLRTKDFGLWDNSGAVNPVANLTDLEVNVDMEQVYLWNPEIIYIGNFTDLQPSDLLENKSEGEDWSMIQAVQDGEVYKIPVGGYYWDAPGAETPLAIKWRAKIQHPELFADMDMETELRDYYQEMYNFTLADEMVEEVLGDTQN